MLRSTKVCETSEKRSINEDNENSQKTTIVYNMFKKFSTNYDILLDLAFLGFHRLWRNRLITVLDPTENTKLVDMAGGTGDIAFRFLDYVKTHNLKGCHVTVSDINEHMLEAGRTGRKSSSYDPTLITWAISDAESSSFPDESFNAYTISFGVRNCTHYDKVLREAYRILESGGKFLCLEASRPENFFAKRMISAIARSMWFVFDCIFNGNMEAYKCFVKAYDTFPGKEQFKVMIEEAGFENVSYESFVFGAFALHTATKP